MAIDYAQITKDILGLFQPTFDSANPGVGIAYPNGPFDYNNPPDLWVEFDVVFANASQIGPSLTPKTRQRGTVYLIVYAREGTGVFASQNLLKWFSGALGYKSVNRTQLQAPEACPASPVKGWSTSGLKVYFWTDEA